MMLIKIEANSSGGHDNQSSVPKVIPSGWAVVPDNIAIPETFPFVNLEVYGDLVTAMTAGIIPEPEPQPEPEPTLEERLEELETNKAEQRDLDALSAAIERGLSL